MKLSQIKPIHLVESDENDAGYATTQDIRASVYPRLEHELAKLNRRADKLGVPNIIMTKNRTFTKTEKDSNGMKRAVEYYEVSIDGDAPHVPGYEFLATIEHKDGGNIIRTVPGTSNSLDLRDFHGATPDYCDHCKKRRRRIDTFIIRDRDGNMRQIGRNCLSDFLGGKDPKQMLFWFSLKGRVEGLMDRFDDDGYGGYGGYKSDYTVPPHEVLMVAGSLIKHYGYRKVDKYGSDYDSTANMIRIVFFNFDPKIASHVEYLKVAKGTREVGEAYRDEALEWFNALSDEDKRSNNFLHNLDVAINSSSATYRDVGIIGALFPAYERAKERMEKTQKGGKSNDYVGNIGDKLPRTKVKVVKTTWIANNFSYNAPDNQLVIMEDDAGNQYKWFNGSRHELEEGATYYIVGKIKSHDDYRGRKSTRLTHVKAEEV